MAKTLAAAVAVLLVVATAQAIPMKMSSSLYSLISKCEVAKDGVHPAVDLNKLSSSSEYRVKSQATEGSEYVFQVCNAIKETSGPCTAGTSVCEIYENKTAREVYGFVDSIQLDWDMMGGKDVLTMTMTGSPECKMSPTKQTITKIFFSCDEKVTEPKPTLKAESEYGCFVEIDFATKVVCNSSEPDTYKCVGGQCVAAEGGGSKEACESFCEGDTYACVDDVCKKSSEGPFPSEEKCEADCGTYVCEDQKCVRKAGGMKRVMCEEQCEPTLYTCHNEMCVVSTDGKGVDKEQCEQLCGGGETKYTCVDGGCEETGDKGVSKEECEAKCKAEDLYHCVTGKCEVTEGKGVSKEQCEELCGGGGETKYKCTKGTCEETTSGGVTKEQCEQLCGGGEEKYHCVDGKCEVTSGKGVDKEQCENLCG